MFKFKPVVIPSPPIILPDLPEVDYFEGFLSDEKANYYFNTLSKELEFKSETYSFYDQSMETKRKMSYHSEHSYTYSEKVYPGKPWTETLKELKLLILNKTGIEFNAVLCNFYPTGDAGMGWHADKEKELGKAPVIASLSLGQTRKFAFRYRKEIVKEKNPKKLIEYNLSSGDLLIMKGNTQAYFEHCIIKQKSAKNPRLNLTFRKIMFE